MKCFRLMFMCLLILGITYESFGCKCGIAQRDTCVLKRMKKHDIVFLGELIESDSIRHSFSFKVLELFKGSNKNRVIKGGLFNSCSYFPTKPNDKGLWIIYAQFRKDSLIDINECGPSMSLFNPGFIIPPPPLLTGNHDINGLEWKVKLFHNNIVGIENWDYELYKLRLYKQLNNETPKSKIDYKLLIIGFSLLLNIFMFILIIKKKKMPAPASE